VICASFAAAVLLVTAFLKTSISQGVATLMRYGETFEDYFIAVENGSK